VSPRSAGNTQVRLPADRNAARRNPSGLCPVPSVRPRCGRQQDVPCAGQASDASLGLGWRSYIRPYDRRRDAVCCRQRRRCDHSGLRALDHGGAAASDDEARRRLPTSSSLTGSPCLRRRALPDVGKTLLARRHGRWDIRRTIDPWREVRGVMMDALTGVGHHFLHASNH
jgi:hypothetical protein